MSYALRRQPSLDNRKSNAGRQPTCCWILVFGQRYGPAGPQPIRCRLGRIYDDRFSQVISEPAAKIAEPGRWLSDLSHAWQLSGSTRSGGLAPWHWRCRVGDGVPSGSRERARLVVKAIDLPFGYKGTSEPVWSNDHARGSEHRELTKVGVLCIGVVSH